MICKIIGGIGLCIVYTFYYTEGGDVTNYFLSTRTFVNVILEGNFNKFFELMDYKNNNVWEILSNNNTFGYFLFAPSDYYALFTVSITIPFCLLAGKSFIATTVLLSSFSFIGLWKLYEVFVDHFPNLSRQFAIAIFFIPSVFFWGSGILKDTYTLSAIGFYIYGLYKFQILKQRKLKYLLLILGSIVIFVYIKPYYFFALLPGSLIWIFFQKITKIQNPILRIMIVPILLSTTIILVIGGLQVFGQYLGEYSLDYILLKAVKTQQDLIRVEYGGNSYNIGIFEPTLTGIISKLPAALNMAFFRPYIWDTRNAVMLLSGLENLFMLGFSLYILIKVKFSTLIKSLFSNPLLIFSFLFALFFAFSIGLTTANYGALVRLKIPCIPFYLCSLFILYYLNKASFKNK
ncbi:MAG: hypothetical protein H0U95_18265 [Bacteroidetes bacterium]|nr:hypothetical protein [Bacteroidota bacterium]